MGAMDARNMYSNLAVNKYLHTVASCWISSTLNYDARNHEYKIYYITLVKLYYWNYSGDEVPQLLSSRAACLPALDKVFKLGRTQNKLV